MLIERDIGGIQFDVDVEQANELYFTESFARKITESGISGIIEAIYQNTNIKYPALSGLIELTDMCNFNCPFCYINESGMIHHSQPRFDEGFKNELDYLIEHGLIYCILSGGECLIHPDFVKIYTHLKMNGVLVTVFTNGYLLNDELISLFEKNKPFKMEISVYGIDDESYQITTNTKNISSNRVFSNILKLQNAGIHVICKTPITTLTEGCYEQIKDWCLQHGIVSVK